MWTWGLKKTSVGYSWHLDCSNMYLVYAECDSNVESRKVEKNFNLVVLHGATSGEQHEF